MIKDVKQNDFDKEVLSSEKKVLVDFYADWCGPCKMVRPILGEIAEGNDAVKFVAVNIEDEDELAEKYNVSSIPCLVVFENGEEIERNVGLLSKNDINKLIED